MTPSIQCRTILIYEYDSLILCDRNRHQNAMQNENFIHLTTTIAIASYELIVAVPGPEIETE